MAFADDLTATNSLKRFNRDEIEGVISDQGNAISSIIRRLQLAVNQGKTQFIAIMSSQRRKASRLSIRDREERQQKLTISMDGTRVKESESLRTLGVSFDERLNFAVHWEEMMSPVLKRIRAINLLGSHLTFLERKELGWGFLFQRSSIA